MTSYKSSFAVRTQPASCHHHTAEIWSCSYGKFMSINFIHVFSYLNNTSGKKENDLIPLFFKIILSSTDSEN